MKRVDSRSSTGTRTWSSWPQGEYVALEKVEGAYSVSPLISQIYLHGDSLKSYLVAVIVPEPPVFQVRQAVLKEMEKTAASAKLLGFERIKNIHLTMEPFSVENELLTPTFKLKRAMVGCYANTT
ncbi:hypothetical protein PGT21_000825 [Puccinia graminis f. sp. tritici]|uniref:AMP-binding enzyme C-terminal domain-containing protein n=1 Tax=Puccinia graminis f. sp. tritici TaxID=56615 RepID=A0A5B0M6G0_PUCGR|nr:hypothetical protein PGT21_000825 [Puccinia graminis f. sp. tritici]